VSTWESAADDWARSRAPASTRATFGEIAAAGAREGALGTVFGAGEMEHDAYAELEQRLYAETGQTAVEFTDRWGGRQSADPIPLTDRAYLIGQNLGKLDKGQREAIAPLVDITGRAQEAAAKASQEDAAVFARTYGIGGNAVKWAALLGRQALDPVNLASAAVTGGEGGVANVLLGISGRGAVATLGRMAVAGAEQAAITEPLVASARENIGLPNDPYLKAVAGGAFFNLALGGGVMGLLRGAAAAGRWYRARGIEPPIHPDDALAVADAVETQNVMTEQAQPATPAARAAMPERIDRAGQALEGHGVKPEDPVAGGGADPTPALARDLEHQAATGGTEGGAPTAPPDLGPHQVEIGGKRYAVTYKLRELDDLTVSHFMDGRPNPGYPAEAQPRDLSTPGSRGLVSEAAAHYQPALALDQSESAAIGPPIVTPSLVTMVGNRRLQMLARVYDRHPEHADAYRAGLAARGYNPEGMKFPVLVRELRDELTPPEMRTIGREGNVSPTGKMSAGEQAFADAQVLDNELLAMHRGGAASSLANVPFVRAFVDRTVATTEREAFISKDNVVSVEGVRRVEAALVAKAYEAPDVVAGLFEVTEPSSRAILGALADNAALAARVKAEIAAGRIASELDPSPALIEAFRLVERARKSGQKVDVLAGQVDLELGAVPPATLDALDYYFRDPPKSKAAKEAGVAYRIAAGRVAIAPQIDRAMNTALSKADAAGDLFGLKPDAGFALREGGTAEMPPGDLTAGEDLAAPAAEGAAAAEPVLALEAPVVQRGSFGKAEFKTFWRALQDKQPFTDEAGLNAIAPGRQAELGPLLRSIAELVPGTEAKVPKVKSPERISEKIRDKDYNSAQQITDAVRGGFIVHNADQGDQIVAALAATGKVQLIDEGWFRTELGYVDRKVALVYPDGMLGELQLWPPEIFAAKDKGHELYEEWRVEKDPVKKTELKAEQVAYWAPVVEALPDVWGELKTGASPNLASSGAKTEAASAAESSRQPLLNQASPITLEPSTGRQPSDLSTNAAVGTSRDVSTVTASRPSQSQERIVAITPDIGAAQQKIKPPLGDPQLAAEADSVIADVGEDFLIKLGEPGSDEVRTLSIAAARAEAAEVDAAAEELLACIAGAGGAAIAGGAATAGAAAAP
jgi:hypothetical protein